MPGPTAITPPGVVVILPTYRRVAPLVWSLSSVLAQRFEGLAIGSARVVVVNNDVERAPVEEAVRAAVAEMGAGPWKVEVFHRDPPLDPVLSWYGAIEQFTAPGDVSFLHGDDDLLLMDSLAVRTRLLLETGAAMLLSRSATGIVFDAVDPLHADLGEGFTLARVAAGPAQPARIPDLDRYSTAFIGNHAYRCSEAFSRGYRAVLARMEALPIAGQHQRAMLPQLLALELCDRGALALTDAHCAVRGQTRDEVVGASFGVANWSSPILFASVLAALEGDGWRGRRDLDQLRHASREQLAYFYFSALLDGRARRQLRALGLAGVGQFWPRYRRRLLAGAALVLKSLVGARGLRTRFRLNLERTTRADVLGRLRATGS